MKYNPRQSIFYHPHMSVADVFLPPKLTHRIAEAISTDGCNIVRDNPGVRVKSGKIDRSVERIAAVGLGETRSWLAAHLDHALSHQSHFKWTR